VDTLVSKISQSKVRPFFNIVNGGWKELQTAKQAQQYFDLFYDQENVNKIVTECFKDACVLDTGVVYVDTDDTAIKRAHPWQVYIDPADKTYGTITKVYYERTDYPRSSLPEKVEATIKNDAIEYLTYGIYWDKVKKIKVYTVNGSIQLVEPYELDKLPFVWLYYDNPMVGIGTVSIVDVLYTIQQDIDTLCSKIHDAMFLTPANMVFMPEGSGISSNQYNNREGNIYTYKPNPNMTGVPVSVVTPPMIDPNLQAMLTELINRAYDMVGISQLSAQSKKPTGLDSGIALATMEDVESERFEVQLSQIIHCYVNIAKICIASFDPSQDILPESSNRMNIKWRDVVKASKNMVIQYSAADSLSKDPSTKLQQLQLLVQAGIIPKARVAQFMQLPDLEGGYSIAQDALNAVNVVIMKCLEEDIYEVPDYIPFDLLREEILHTQLTLTASNSEKNEKDIQKLTKLFESIEDKVQDYAANDVETTAEVAEDYDKGNMPDSLMTVAETQNNAPTPAGQQSVDKIEQPMDGSPWTGPINQV
jgi:DNA-binding protein H-NS